MHQLRQAANITARRVALTTHDSIPRVDGFSSGLAGRHELWESKHVKVLGCTILSIAAFSLPSRRLASRFELASKGFIIHMQRPCAPAVRS